MHKKAFLILENLRVHHSKVIKAWLEDHKEQIELFFLPAYSPELNPDEYRNGDLKQRIRSDLPARTEKDLTKKTRSFMKTLQKRAHHEESIFYSKIGIYRSATIVKKGISDLLYI